MQKNLWKMVERLNGKILRRALDFSNLLESFKKLGTMRKSSEGYLRKTFRKFFVLGVS